MDLLNLLVPFFSDYGYLAVFVVLLVCGFGVPIPEDITLVAGGVISGLGFADVHTMFAVSMLGVLIGDSTMFWVGRIYGSRVLRWRWAQRILTQERYEAVQDKFTKYGNRVLFVARFLPGLRAPIYLSAGMSCCIPFWRFLLLDGLAAIISVPVWVYLGYFGANNIDWLLTWVERGQVGILSVVGVLVVGLGLWWWRRKKKAKDVA
ncbi:DedA family protein [Chitinibacteraceae bacterium HSL-7]